MSILVALQHWPTGGEIMYFRAEREKEVQDIVLLSILVSNLGEVRTLKLQPHFIKSPQ